MPRYTPEVAKLKADSLTKLVLDNGLNQAAVARKLGCTRQNIQDKLAKKPVQDALQSFINSPKLKNRLIKVAQEALKAQTLKFKEDKNGKVHIKKCADHDARHKYWHDLLTAGGILKNEGGGTKIINIIHAYRNKPEVSAVRNEE